jgi:hypothetical protein
MAEEKVGELYFELKATTSKLEAELNKVKNKINSDSKQIEDKLNFKAKFDSGIAKLRISELQKLQIRLRAEFDKKVKMNVDSASLDRTRQKLSSVESQLGGVGKAATSMGNKILTAFVALGAVRAVFNTIKESIRLSMIQTREENAVEQAVLRTGQAAGYTATQLFKMAGELQNITGIGDEEILKGVTKQLLTFTQVTGESFKRAQVAVLDLNAVIAGGETASLTSQSIQLGKALEDPIRGVGALSRAGVTFTQEQKKMIQQFVRTNDVMSAQNIILTEIENKYGGQAQAIAEAEVGTKQLQAAVGDLEESFGAMIITIPGLNWLITNLTGGLKTLTKWFQGSSFYVNQFKASLDDLKNTSKEVTLDNLKNSTKSLRDETKKFNEEQIAANKKEYDEIKKQIVEKQSSLRFSNDEIDALKQRQAVLSRNSATARGELEAIKKYEENLTKLNTKWEKQGKTLGQVQDRISYLSESLTDFEVGSIDANKIKAEIEDLNKFISDKKIKPTADNKFLENLTDALDEYRNKIKVLNDELSNLGVGGTEEKKLIITAELTRLENQLRDAEFEIGVKVNFDSANIDTEALQDAFASETDSSIVEQLQANLDLRLQAQQEYINRVSLLNEEAYKDAETKIDEEYEMFVAAGVAKEEAQLIHDSKMKELRDKKQEEENAITEAQLANLEAVAQGLGGFAAFAKQMAGEQSAAYKLFAISEATIATYLAATKALASVPYPFNFIAAAGVTAAGLGNVAQIISAHKGGEFVGTPSGVKKLSGGGSFIVPGGYPNDSYPMLVESGERVSVTPANKVSKDINQMAVIANKLDVLNANLISKNFAPIINNSLEVDGRKLAKTVNKTSYKMQKEGKSF